MKLTRESKDVQQVNKVAAKYLNGQQWWNSAVYRMEMAQQRIIGENGSANKAGIKVEQN